MPATPTTKLFVALAVTVSAFALLGGGSAWAATLSSTLVGNSSIFRFEAGSGERNRLSVAPSVFAYRFVDSGAEIQAGDNCSATPDPHAVLCVPLGLVPVVDVELGDRADTFEDQTSATSMTLRRTIVFGGAGNDRLIGGPGGDLVHGPRNMLYGGQGNDFVLGRGSFDELEGDGGNSAGGGWTRGGDDEVLGGPGSDFVRGGAGEDRLSGGPGNDTLEGESGGVDALTADRLSGGDGIDISLSFSDRSPAKLAATLDGRANDGRKGEHDNFAADLERAYSITFDRRLPNPIPTPEQERVEVVGKGSVRIYRLSLRTTELTSGWFEGSGFTVAESRSARAPTSIVLSGRGFEACRPRSGLARAAKKKRVHSLEANTNGGGFRTRGRNSAATVRGTKWTVTDRCDGTLTTVRSGTVRVRDFRLRKTIVLRAGQQYLAR